MSKSKKTLRELYHEQKATNIDILQTGLFKDKTSWVEDAIGCYSKKIEVDSTNTEALIECRDIYAPPTLAPQIIAL